MAVTEASRYELHKHFEETMGRELATTLMELLPPVGWGDVATKRDLALVKQDLALVKQDVAALSERMATKDDLHALELEMHKIHNSLFREVRIWAMALFTGLGVLTGMAVTFVR